MRLSEIEDSGLGITLEIQTQIGPDEFSGLAEIFVGTFFNSGLSYLGIDPVNSDRIMSINEKYGDIYLMHVFLDSSINANLFPKIINVSNDIWGIVCAESRVSTKIDGRFSQQEWLLNFANRHQKISTKN